MTRPLSLIALMLLAAAPLSALAPLSAQVSAQAPQGWLADPKTGCRVWAPPGPQRETISWTGPCENNVAQGRGVLQFFLDGTPNGRYDGDLRDGKMNGRGVYTFPNGDRYDGEYRDGARSGRSVYTWTNGDRFDGEYRDDKRTGRGVHTFASGGSYDGEWRDDKRAGRGVLTFPGGGQYDGEFRDGKPNGTGTLTSADGKRTYSGQWNNGCFRDGNRRATAGPTWKECGFD